MSAARRNTLGGPGVGGESEAALALGRFEESTESNNKPWPSELDGFKLSSYIMKGCTGQ